MPSRSWLLSLSVFAMSANRKQYAPTLHINSRWNASRPCGVRHIGKSFRPSLFGVQCLFKVPDSPTSEESKIALEKTPDGDSAPSGEARQRPKPRQRTP